MHFHIVCYAHCGTTCIFINQYLCVLENNLSIPWCKICRAAVKLGFLLPLEAAEVLTNQITEFARAALISFSAIINSTVYHLFDVQMPLYV